MQLLLAVSACALLGAVGGAMATSAAEPPPRSPIAVAPVRPLFVTSPFGVRGASFHSGVDLAAREGAPLVAVAPATVIGTPVGGNGGKRVLLRLDGGWRAGYAHLSRVDVETGQRLKPGEVLGRAGHTGHATGPHLHFELREPVHQRLVDPWPHLAPHRSRGELLVEQVGARARSATSSAASSAKGVLRSVPGLRGDTPHPGRGCREPLPEGSLRSLLCVVRRIG